MDKEEEEEEEEEDGTDTDTEEEDVDGDGDGEFGFRISVSMIYNASIRFIMPRYSLTIYDFRRDILARDKDGVDI